jgi:TonB family protein
MNPSPRRPWPWSVRLVFLALLVCAAAFAWSKRPFVSDAEKVCNVTRLSSCPSPESSIVSNDCKIAWLEHSMWRFGRLAALQRGTEPGGADVLRGLARESGLVACPEADVVEREFERWRQLAEAANPKPGSAVEQVAHGSAREPSQNPPLRGPSGVVKVEAPAVDGTLDPSLVVKEVRTRLGAVKACYERALRRSPKLSGKVKVHWTITTQGTVADVEMDEDSVGDSEVSSCLKVVVRRWRFVASDGPVDVVYPFVFEPKEESR